MPRFFIQLQSIMGTPSETAPALGRRVHQGEQPARFRIQGAAPDGCPDIVGTTRDVMITSSVITRISSIKVKARRGEIHFVRWSMLVF